MSSRRLQSGKKRRPKKRIARPTETAASAPNVDTQMSLKTRVSNLIAEQGDLRVRQFLTAALDGVNIVASATPKARFDRRSSTIAVPSGKTGAAFLAAVLFELNEAQNTYYFTDKAEAVLIGIAEEGGDPTSADFLVVANEMLKDEFLSLVSYYQQVKRLYPNGNIPPEISEKYEGLLDADDNLSYEAFEEQSIRSGHIIDLALSQFNSFDLNEPYELYIPVRYRNVPDRARGASRRESGVDSELAREKRLGLTTPGAYFDNLPKFDPIELQDLDFSEDYEDDLEALEQLPPSSQFGVSEEEIANLDFDSFLEDDFDETNTEL